MREVRLGISLYPEFASAEACREYLRLAARHGYRVLFVALLGVRDERDEVTARYRALTDEAHALGFEVFCDVNPSVLARFGVNASVLRGRLDLGFLQEIGCDVMRLDLGLSEMEEAFLTRNEAGIGVCLNASANACDHIGALLASGGEPARIVGCHNYYPHRYTGLTLEYFLTCSRRWKERGLPPRHSCHRRSRRPSARGRHATVCLRLRCIAICPPPCRPVTSCNSAAWMTSSWATALRASASLRQSLRASQPRWRSPCIALPVCRRSLSGACASACRVVPSKTAISCAPSRAGW